MEQSNALISKNLTIELGDLQVDFLGTSKLLSAEEIATSPLHLHTKHEFHFILSGSMQLWVNNDRMLQVNAGSVLLIPPNLLHHNAQECASRLSLLLALQQTHHGADFSEYDHYCALFGTMQEPLVFEDEIIRFCVDQLTNLPDLPQNTHKRKSLLSLLFIRLAEGIATHTQNTPQPQKLQPGTQYNRQYFLIEQHINTHYHQKTSVEEIATLLHISRRQADRIVLKIFGKTYAALILERRMSVAGTLLQKTDMTCTAVAEKVGYTSYPGFYLAFKQHFGHAPEDLREHKKMHLIKQPLA